MARKTKIGIDYFSHDVHCTTDRKLRLLKAKHKVVGYGIYFLLLEEIYKEGYCLHLNEEFNILFISEHNLDENVYINCLNDCINFSLFDKKRYDKYKVLTSKRIQENYIEAIVRRKGVIIDVNILMLNADILPDNVSISTQKRIKETKTEETKEDESKTLIESFESWWSLYEKKGNREESLTRWLSLKQDERDKCFHVVVDYVKSTPNKKYRRGGQSYLLKKMFNDEIIEDEERKPKQGKTYYSDENYKPGVK
jgi:hypothetical protein